MDYHTSYLHDLARDIVADDEGNTIFVDAGGAVMKLPFADSDKLVDYLKKLGVICKKRFMHTIMVIDYPEGFEFTESDAKLMAKELWGA